MRKEILTFTLFQNRLELLGQNMDVWKYKGHRSESKYSHRDSYILFVCIELRYIEVINTDAQKTAESDLL